MMLKQMLAALVLGLSAPVLAEPIGLQVGDRTLEVAMPPSYVRASEAMPSAFATAAAALPPNMRLVEQLMAESDIKHLLLEGRTAQPYVQVQTLRDSEQVSFTAEDWDAMRPALVAQLGTQDLSKVATAMQDGAGERMGKTVGGTVELSYGDVGQPVLYDLGDQAVHYTLRLPLTAVVNGITREIELEAVGAMVVAGGRLLFVNGYAHRTEGGPRFAARPLVEALVADLVSRNAPR